MPKGPMEVPPIPELRGAVRRSLEAQLDEAQRLASRTTRGSLRRRSGWISKHRQDSGSWIDRHPDRGR